MWTSRVCPGGGEMKAIWKLLPASIAMAILLSPANAVAQTQVTFTKDVAPILQNKCQVCHRPGTFAPMSLLTFEDVRPWAKAIKEKVTTRMMPRWYIDRNVGIRHFQDDPSLSDQQIETIVKWVDNGAPMGNPANMPPPRQFDDLEKWHVASPDLIIQLPKDIIVPATAPDRWIDIEVDSNLTEDRYIQAIETKPIKGYKVIHHALT